MPKLVLFKDGCYGVRRRWWPFGFSSFYDLSWPRLSYNKYESSFSDCYGTIEKALEVIVYLKQQKERKRNLGKHTVVKDLNKKDVV